MACHDCHGVFSLTCGVLGVSGIPDWCSWCSWSCFSTPILQRREPDIIKQLQVNVQVNLTILTSMCLMFTDQIKQIQSTTKRSNMTFYRFFDVDFYRLLRIFTDFGDFGPPHRRRGRTESPRSLLPLERALPALRALRALLAPMTQTVPQLRQLRSLRCRRSPAAR